MSKRQFLSSAVAGLFGVLVLSFLWVLFSGINFGSNDDEQHKLYKGLTQGDVVLRRYQGQAVWVLRLSEKQQLQAEKLEDFVVNKPNSIDACQQRNEYCVLNAETERAGINIHYTEQAPAQLPNDSLWYGGFVNPTNGALYDFLGRLYKGQKSNQSMKKVSLN